MSKSSLLATSIDANSAQFLKNRFMDERKTSSINCRLSPITKNRLGEMAKMLGVSVAVLTRFLIERFISLNAEETKRLFGIQHKKIEV